MGRPWFWFWASHFSFQCYLLVYLRSGRPRRSLRAECTPRTNRGQSQFSKYSFGERRTFYSTCSETDRLFNKALFTLVSPIFNPRNQTDKHGLSSINQTTLAPFVLVCLLPETTCYPKIRRRQLQKKVMLFCQNLIK